MIRGSVNNFILLHCLFILYLHQMHAIFCKNVQLS